VLQARALAKEGVPRSQIAAQLNLSESQLRRIILRETWKHLPDH